MPPEHDDYREHQLAADHLVHGVMAANMHPDHAILYRVEALD